MRGRGENIGGYTMKRKTKSAVSIDWVGTRAIRQEMASQKFVKITVNVDAKSLSALKNEAKKSGVPYQRLLNALLREGIEAKKHTDSRLDKLEKEVEKVKRKLAV
jgi:hypothetical protein